MGKNNLQTLVIGLMMATSVLLGGCAGTDKKPNERATPINEPSAVDTTVQEETNTKAELDGASPEQATPMTYNISAWKKEKVKPLSVNNLSGIKATFGKVVSTDDNSLDYASNPASKYRFMSNDAPYLDLIDSEKYLELGWYYANPTDSKKEKMLSADHAKKSYILARQLMGEDGSKVLTDMLAGQTIKDKTVGGQKIELAKCEYYSCMLVLDKSDV